MSSTRNTQTHFHRKAINKWVLARKITQGLALCAFLVTLLLSKNLLVPSFLSKDLARISPLVMAAELLSSKTFLAGSALALVILLSSFVVGRAWCGWLCPLGTMLDIFHFSGVRRQKDLPQDLRKIKYGLLILILFSALLDNLTFLFLDPITIFIRSMTLAVLPVLDRGIYFLESLLIKVPWLSGTVLSFDTWLRPNVFPVDSEFFQYALLFGILFISLLVLNLLAERFWCRYLCPLGALLGLGARVSIFQKKVKSNCVACGLCAESCPTGTIDPKNGYKSDPSECTMCMNCLERCNQESITFTDSWHAAPKQAYDPGRRLFLGSLGLSAAFVALFGVEWTRKHPPLHLLRPPGVQDEAEFLKRCARCGICMQICPTQALQPNLDESGFEGAGTPILVPRNGYCAYSCNACGQNCPVGAIPALIDHNRCLAWGEHENCIVCEEMCPLPEKAISLEKSQDTRTDIPGEELLLPVVNSNRCIGCGICENKCPVVGDAAIRVEII